MTVPQRVRRITLAGASTLGLLAGSTLIGFSGAGAALPAATDFSYTGSAQTYVVPADVCAVQIVAAGAQGGTVTQVAPNSVTPFASAPPGPVPGGEGGVATSTVTVTPGESLQVNVGGQGNDGGSPGNGEGGWNGGGAGGNGVGGGGGGASDVRQGGTGLAERVVIGGGGGGVGFDVDTSIAPDYGVPGVGGNPATPGGDEPPDPGKPSYIPATGGGAGTASAGGAAGQGFIDGDSIGPAGVAGQLGIGGAGATGGEVGGGGGGGGLYGGGGGGIGNWYSDGSGGGGSSLGDATQPGANEGNGSVTITPTADCQPTTTSTTTTTAPAPVTVANDVATAPEPVVANPSYTG